MIYAIIGIIVAVVSLKLLFYILMWLLEVQIFPTVIFDDEKPKGALSTLLELLAVASVFSFGYFLFYRGMWGEIVALSEYEDESNFSFWLMLSFASYFAARLFSYLSKLSAKHYQSKQEPN
ncbi:hypothetical protein [Thalassotalea litorea]|uniref:hypothetical protein n=1 Tax=Thalassotalea litorea TaxID=2020715 RepID=UPI003736BF68